MHEKDLFYIEKSTNTQQALDLILPLNLSSGYHPPILIFLHGGAWRTGDKSEFLAFGEGLSRKANVAVALVNYRLSTKETSEVKHPNHIEDVAAAVFWIHQHGKKYNYRQDRIYLVGHSAGAFLASQLVFMPEYLDRYDSSIRDQIRGVVGIEGIYDLVELVETWPSYIDFVSGAFGIDETIYKTASPQHYTPTVNIPPYLIIHSRDDELVHLAHSQKFVFHVQKFAVKCDFDTSLTGTHDGILKTGNLVDRIAEFVIMLESRELDHQVKL
ncbi:4561_t:CDS:1 [Paraglomus brasilianum]|uniref:Kynurenine formamidase n=1 Tax=Paraglomus brasilianum TaxID=144538 RepID=A0A9N9FR56_9GLOM|nr:4561_t:CDS:1 [Paraglomus brasilianum]